MDATARRRHPQRCETNAKDVNVAHVNSHSPQEPDPDEPLLVLGIDGGGTKTTAIVAARGTDGSLVAIGRGGGGPANPRSSGWDVARQNLDRAMDEAFAAAGRPRAPVAALCLALAGSGHASVRDQAYQWCGERKLARVWQVVHDAQIVLRAGTPDGMGVALISGTGSLAYGQTPDGRSARAGGWGYLLGDEGSGYAIGLAALRAIVRAADQRGPATGLTAALLGQLELRSPGELIPRLYGDPEVRRSVASLAPSVLAVAGAGDSVAQRIVEHAAGELCDLVGAVTGSLACTDGSYRLALAGGLLEHHAALRAAVLRHLAERRSIPLASAVVADPVWGAVLMAGDLIG
jgi:N-acetylmuramic acid 6-phosphate etherase